EKRLHQDGKIHIKVNGREIDIRVSTYASVFGETVVMRLLDRERGILPLGEVGFQPRALLALQESVLAAASGLVLTVGPTGSGKTTTLYSFIQHANDPSEKVITCEDPVEYVIDGIIQCSVNNKTGPTFADSLRAIVRQDPDTIVVGEIRDPATAHLAAEAALTGHKVYSTFHTEDAVGAFVRFTEMGVEPFLVASTLSAVIAQRLVRRLCPECRAPHRPTLAELRVLHLDRESLTNVSFMRATGCAHCSNTGYKGRIAIHEVLVPDQAFREAVLNRASSGALRELARARPEFLTMQEDGILKALRGVTSLAEVIENAPRDLSSRPLVDLQRIARGRAQGVAA
ncbi:MAG: GspE/PulE family protein, partial [Gemmatimonadaceae bacterium]|nr:GspE/PulE family protein [Gemmatimonadaceae bacterium]